MEALVQEHICDTNDGEALQHLHMHVHLQSLPQQCAASAALARDDSTCVSFDPPPHASEELRGACKGRVSLFSEARGVSLFSDTSRAGS